MIRMEQTKQEKKKVSFRIKLPQDVCMTWFIRYIYIWNLQFLKKKYIYSGRSNYGRFYFRKCRDRRCRDRMIVGFTTTGAISGHHY